MGVGSWELEDGRVQRRKKGGRGALGTDLAAFPDYAHRAARSIHPRVGSRGSAAALRCNTRRGVAWSLIQAARARSHSRSPFGTRRSASGESRYEYERPFCRHYSALPDLPFTNDQTQSRSRVTGRSGILELPELSRLPRHATRLRSEVGGQKSEDRGQRTEDRGQRTEDRGQRTEDTTATSRRYRPRDTSAVRTSSRSLIQRTRSR
jgi:hypothetical protein